MKNFQVKTTYTLFPNAPDCWYKCGEKGGKCAEFCGPRGYCCATYSWAHDCEDDAVEAIRRLTKKKHHVCVYTDHYNIPISNNDPNFANWQ